VKWVVIVSAALVALVAWFAAATSPNPTDHLAGKIIVAIAAGFVAMAIWAPPKVTAWVYFVTVALLVLVYTLPLSFWRAVGLAKEQPSQQGPGPSARDNQE